jgi:hypothetical protein
LKPEDIMGVAAQLKEEYTLGKWKRPFHNKPNA